MRGGFLRRLNDLLGWAFGRKPCDIFRDGSVKKLHPLWQIADMLAQNLGCIIIKRCTI